MPMVAVLLAQVWAHVLSVGTLVHMWTYTRFIPHTHISQAATKLPSLFTFMPLSVLLSLRSRHSHAFCCCQQVPVYNYKSRRQRWRFGRLSVTMRCVCICKACRVLLSQTSESSGAFLFFRSLNRTVISSPGIQECRHSSSRSAGRNWRGRNHFKPLSRKHFFPVSVCVRLPLVMLASVPHSRYIGNIFQKETVCTSGIQRQGREKIDST